MRFFDRFVYKNPKKQIAKHGKITSTSFSLSLFTLTHSELLRKKSRHAIGRLYLPKGVKAVAVDSTEYTRLNPTHIPADERFLYTYVCSLLPTRNVTTRSLAS
jgi:hypothetical protein